MGSISPLGASVAQASAEVRALTVDVGFTTRLAGKTYDADVVYTGGQYVAVDSSLSGAEAKGTSVPSAEDNLIARIDALV